MSPVTEVTRADALAAADAVLAAEAARRYYLGNESKVDIAAAMRVSRFKVARLLEAARNEGIVRIEIVDRSGVDSSLSAELREAYGIERCVVVDCPDDPHLRRTQVGRAGADMLLGMLGPGDTLGLPWARTVSAMVDALPALPPVSVVQLSGALVIPGEHSPVDMVRAAAVLTGGETHIYYAPLILDDAESATTMRRQPAVSRALAEAAKVSVAVVSIGAWATGHSTIHDALPAKDRAEVKAAGAVGEALGVFVDAEGTPVRTDVGDRLVTIGTEGLRRVPQTLALATGKQKATAVRAFLVGGWVEALVVDRALGAELLRRARA